MKRSNRILHFDNLDLLGIGIALFIVSFYVYILIPFFIFYVYKVRRHISIILFGIIALIIGLCFYVETIREIPHEINGSVTVTRIDRFDTYDQVIIRFKRNNYLLYTSNDMFQIGDEVYLKAVVKTYPKQTVPRGFNPYHYYKSLKISGKLKIIEIERIDHHYHHFGLREKLLNFYEEMNLSPYFYLMIFGTSLEDDIEETYRNIGVMHLLSLSGIHLLVLIIVIKKLYYYIDVPMRFQRYSILMIYVLFCYLHRFDVGVTRLLILALLKHLNELFEWRKSRFELIQAAFLCLVFLNHHLILSQSFLILYLIITGLNLVEPVYRKYDGLIKRFVMGLIVYCILIPFQSELNFLTLILLPLISLPVAGILMMSSVLVILFKEFNPIFLKCTHIIEILMDYLSKYSIQIVIGKLEPIFILSYYLLLIMMLISRAKIKKFFLTAIIMSLYIFPHLIRMNHTSVTFLDVGQGDSTIIKSNQCVTVIDAYQGIKDYLLNQEINKIDYLFLTHSDLDHIEEAMMLIDYLKVGHLILSAEDHEYPNYKIKKILTKSGDLFTCGAIQLNVLAPLDDSNSSNESSIVIQTLIGDQTFLFTGDIEIETEKKLVSHYGKNLRSDVLKIAHHGSVTSTSSIFLMHVKPKIAVISVGRDNRYGFPSDDVMMRLLKESIVIYRTDLHGTVIYESTKKKAKWILCLPF